MILLPSPIFFFSLNKCLFDNSMRLASFVVKELYVEAMERLTKAVGITNITIYKTQEEGIYDPEKRAPRAKFFRPAIFMTEETKNKTY